MRVAVTRACASNKMLVEFEQIVDKRKAKSDVWKHFGFPADAHGVITDKKKIVCRSRSEPSHRICGLHSTNSVPILCSQPTWLTTTSIFSRSASRHRKYPGTMMQALLRKSLSPCSRTGVSQRRCVEVSLTMRATSSMPLAYWELNTFHV